MARRITAADMLLSYRYGDVGGYRAEDTGAIGEDLGAISTSAQADSIGLWISTIPAPFDDIEDEDEYGVEWGYDAELYGAATTVVPGSSSTTVVPGSSSTTVMPGSSSATVAPGSPSATVTDSPSTESTDSAANSDDDDSEISGFAKKLIETGISIASGVTSATETATDVRPISQRPRMMSMMALSKIFGETMGEKLGIAQKAIEYGDNAAEFLPAVIDDEKLEMLKISVAAITMAIALFVIIKNRRATKAEIIKFAEKNGIPEADEFPYYVHGVFQMTKPQKSDALTRIRKKMDKLGTRKLRVMPEKTKRKINSRINVLVAAITYDEAQETAAAATEEA